MKRTLGVDIGVATGAWSILRDDNTAIVGDLPVVDGMVDAVQWRNLIRELKPDIAVAEIVSAWPGQGVTSSFRFGKASGIITATISILGCPLVLVAPTKWKKKLGLPGKSDKRAPEISRARALQLFPATEGMHLKKHHNRSEALLLAYWLEHHGYD